MLLPTIHYKVGADLYVLFSKTTGKSYKQNVYVIMNAFTNWDYWFCFKLDDFIKKFTNFIKNTYNIILG